MANETKLPEPGAYVGPQVHWYRDRPSGKSISDEEGHRLSSTCRIPSLIVHVLRLYGTKHHRSDHKEPFRRDRLEGAGEQGGLADDFGGSRSIANETTSIDQISDEAVTVSTSQAVIPKA